MNFDITKYDVIIFEEHNLSVKLLELTLNMNELIRKMQLTHLDCDNEVVTILRNGFIHMRDISHLAYENAKDLHQLDPVLVTNFIKKNRLGIEKFPRDYCSNLLDHTKILLLDMILEEENIDLSSVDDIMSLQKITNGDGEGIFDLLGESRMYMKPDNYRIVKLMCDEDFSIDDLEQDDINRLNNYHDTYIKKRILSRVTSQKKEDNRVLTQAKKIGYKAKGSF